MESSFKQILQRLLAKPLQNAVKITMDRQEKMVSFSLPIFTPTQTLSPAVQRYVQAVNEKPFKPHATSFVLEKGEVQLVQKIAMPVNAAPLRELFLQFYRLAILCHRRLMEMAIEEASALVQH